MSTPDPSGFADKFKQLLEDWQLLSEHWRKAAPPLYASSNLYALRDWEKDRLDALERVLVAQQQVNLMVVAAIDDLRKDLADRAS